MEKNKLYSMLFKFYSKETDYEVLYMERDDYTLFIVLDVSKGYLEIYFEDADYDLEDDGESWNIRNENLGTLFGKIFTSPLKTKIWENRSK